MKTRCSSFNAGSNTAKFLTLSTKAVSSSIAVSTAPSIISPSLGLVGSGGTIDCPTASVAPSDDPPVNNPSTTPVIAFHIDATLSSSGFAGSSESLAEVSSPGSSCGCLPDFCFCLASLRFCLRDFSSSPASDTPDNCV